MEGFRIDFTPPSVTERSARITEGEGIQDEERRHRQDSRKKQRKRHQSDKDVEPACDEDTREKKTGKILDIEA